MKKITRRAVSILLSVLLLFMLSLCAFAKEEVTPVIVVSGMGSFPLYTVDENGQIEEENQVFPSSAKGILKVCAKSVLPLANTAIKGDWNIFADGSFESIYSDLFEIVSCDEKGNSAYNLSTRLFYGNVGNHAEYLIDTDKTDDEVGMVKSIAKEIGAENTYFFNYDWRLDPLLHADELNDYIETVKAEKNVSKVTLVPASMGGTVVNSYLYKYGSDSVAKIIYCVVASRGLDLVGELLSKNVEITTDMFLERLFSVEKGDILLQALIGALQTGVEKTGRIDKAIDRFVDNFVTSLSDRAYEEILARSFATMPGIWAFCPDEYYELDKEMMFAKGADEDFIRMLDEYHYNVQCENEKLMNQAQDNGTEIYIIASYGYLGFPVTSVAWEQGDGLIETKNESFGAVCAKYGETFPKDYKADASGCSDSRHCHVSTDGIVDASACSFPEQTWFIKDNRHVGLDYGTDSAKLLIRLVTSDEQLTVHSDEKFPQFVRISLSNGRFKSLTGDEIKPSIMDGHSNIYTRSIAFFSGLFEKFFRVIK